MSLPSLLSSEYPVVIIGAGPIGLEAALAAAEAKLPFVLLEAGQEVADQVRQWQHVQLFTPWSLSVSPRARRALTEVGLEPPTDPRLCPTGAEVRQRVLQPVGSLPSITNALRLGTRVLSISRQGLLKSEELASTKREQTPFRLLTVDANGTESSLLASAVLDCSGTWSHPRPSGDGGIPAPGEGSLGDRIHRQIPDLSRYANLWRGQRVLVVGAGHSAQTAVRDLERLASSEVEALITWALRSSTPHFGVDSDPLPGRASLNQLATELANGGSPFVSPEVETVVESFSPNPDDITVRLRREDGHRHHLTVDRVLSLTGASGDPSLYRELQVHECWATTGPMKLAASLFGSEGGDCLQQDSSGVESLRSPEPNFYILGVKSYGRNSSFLLRVGWQQVEEVFSDWGAPS